MAAGQPLRSVLHFACPTVVDANGRRVPDSLPTMPSQALVVRPPANWSALDAVSTMTGAHGAPGGGWVVYYSTEDAATRRQRLVAAFSTTPVRSLHPHLVRTAGRPGSLRRGRRPQRWSLYRRIPAVIWKNDGNARPASIWEQSLNPDRRSVTGRPACLINADQAPVLSR
jgi:hypothetical protein